MKEELKININLNTQAMLEGGNEEIVNILEDLIERIKTCPSRSYFILRDYNGEEVGNAVFAEINE